MGNTQKKQRRRAERASRRDRIEDRKRKERAVEDAELLEWGVVGRKLPPPKDRKLTREFAGWTEVTVTAVDAAEGMKANKAYCGLCLALARHWFTDVLVTTATLSVNGYTLFLPERIAKLVQAMDDGTATLPFTFRLPVLTTAELERFLAASLLTAAPGVKMWSVGTRINSVDDLLKAQAERVYAVGGERLGGAAGSYVEGRWQVPDGFISGMAADGDDGGLWGMAGLVVRTLAASPAVKLPAQVIVSKDTTS